MLSEQELLTRSNSTCELCGSKENLSVFRVEPKDENILICGLCNDQIKNPEQLDPNHWRCLNDSMWSEIPAVQILSWRMLTLLKNEGWPQDLLDMMYLDEEMEKWAQATGLGIEDDSDKIIHKDSNGAILENGDTVVLIKDLNVKGGNFTAKRGTAVRNISLVHDNSEQIEGKVEGQHIVILTQYVKK